MIKTLGISFVLLIISLNVKAQAVVDYIEEHAGYAQTLMQESKIPASLILGIAIHESASGQSRIAKYLNNHFGVKGPNNNDEIQSSYRDYSSAEESYSHFVEMMQTRAPFNKLFEKCDQYDYKAWAKGIQRSGYAHSRSWAAQVIAIINKYELYQYDNRPADYTEPAAPVITYKRNGRQKPTSQRVYVVKKGDNLSKIAKAHGTTTTRLIHKNGLKKANLKPGQKLKL